MENLLEGTTTIILILAGAYLLGRILMRAGLHELDKYLANKFNKTKTKNNETKEK